MVEKLAEMTVDEFFEHGFDSDSGEDDDDEAEPQNKHMEMQVDKKKEKRSSGSIKHKDQLEALKDKDPEFYKFLKENDEDLLDFSGSDDDDNIGGEDKGGNDDDKDASDSDGISEDDLSGGEQKDGSSDEETGDKHSADKLAADEEAEEEASEQVEAKKGRKVTEKMVKRWKTGLEEDSLKSLKCVFRAFHAAVDSLSVDDTQTVKEQKKPMYLVDTGSMYNNLTKMCLKHSVKILQKNLSSTKKKKFSSTHLPSSNKLWGSVKHCLKQYLHDILQLLRVHTDTSVLTILLRHCQALCPYYACFPKIAKMLLKRLVRMWSSGEEHVRVIAFLCTRALSFLIPRLYEFILKKLYLGFVRNSKFVNLKTRPTITFMKNSLVEMFSYNYAATYKHGFLYIRQLAITLRNAITVKKKDSFQSVYNWQYISCLQLWSQVVSDLNGDVLKPLIYPVVQLNLGVIQLIPAARYYPLRFHCMESLNYISKKTGVYIPTAAYVLQVVESAEILRKPKSLEKPPDFCGVLKLSKSQLQTKGFQDCTIDLAVETLLEHYVIFSNSIAFPELIFPVCHRLKHLMKGCKTFKLCKDMKMVVEKLQTHADTMKKSREDVTFSPKDLELVKKWEEERKSTKNILSEFLDTWKNMKKITDNTQSNEEEEIKVKSKEDRKRKEINGHKEVSTLPVTKKKKGKREKEHKFDNDNDIVEDYKFSDDEDE